MKTPAQALSPGETMSTRGGTIFALSSGAGMAGVAVIRVSGPRARDALCALSGKDLPGPRRATLRRLRDPRGGEPLDDALVLWMPGPESFTGEDVAEFHVHGGRACVQGVLAALGALEGLRMAEPGEFTRRAFENRRMTLIEAEGLADLVRAETQAQRRQALEAAGGAAGAKVEEWRREMIFLLSRLEASIDFPEEEDIAGIALEGVPERLEALCRDLAETLRQAERAGRIREGIRVVVAGPPNAGKSSLLNALARRDVAIVSEIAGTTRDVVEVRLDLAGLPVVLCDTAGLREEADAPGEIERMGIARARRLLETADIVLWMEAPDARTAGVPRFESDAIRIFNKSDLFDSDSFPSGYDLVISVKEGSGLERLEERLTALVREKYDLVIPPVVTRERQKTALRAALEHLRAALSDMERPAELTAELVRLAALELERLIGRVGVEDLLDSIFGEFCIGK